VSPARSAWALAPYVLAVVLVAGAIGVRELDRAWPPALDRAVPVSVEVHDRNGKLLRAFATPAGYWRLRADLDAIDPGFVRMLLVYEDRRFDRHIGIDPLAMARATWQFVRHGRVVSGGSTITMQLARLLDGPKQRSLATKLVQMLRALQIETRLSKREILELYLTLAPYGGNLEGTSAAALAYFGKPPEKLTTAEQALLVALPQLPEHRRPDRHPDAALRARDRVLERMVAAGLLDQAEAGQARRAALRAHRRNLPAHAAHLAQQAVRLEPDRRVHRTTLDRDIQAALETLARERAPGLGERLSIAMLLVDHTSGEVIAHVGSPGIFDTRRWGEIDMVEAVRSPGSALKPFIYGLAFEDGLLLPETLVEDRPADFAGYRPANLDLTYQGTVTARQALQLSLNVPAIELLDSIGPQRLMARMGAAGVRAELPADRAPGLAIGLGGIGLTLRDLVKLYAGLANEGLAVRLKDGIGHGASAPAAGMQLLEPRASWYVADILAGTPPPDFARAAVPYKTGTSYGYRDAWAVGFDGRYALGVWVGRPDNASVPGLTGHATAAPLLFEALERLPAPRLPVFKAPADALRLSTADLPPGLQRFTQSGKRLPVSRGAGVRPPVIVHPPDGARVDLDQAQGGPARLAVKLEGGAAPFRWLANGRPLEGVERRRSLLWVPDSPGASKLTVIDAAGAAASVTVYID
jgi:penicillin-binding protein 1C